MPSVKASLMYDKVFPGVIEAAAPVDRNAVDKVLLANTKITKASERFGMVIE